MEGEPKVTHFHDIYNSFLSLITDDMYMEWSEEETFADLKNIFLASMTNFQFPRFKPYDYTESFIIEKPIAPIDPPETETEPVETPEPEESVETPNDYFNFQLTREEINIYAHLMMVEWVNRQLASVDVVRQAYSSRDFEFTSQANHLAKLMNLKNNFIKESTRMQRLYTRRKMDSSGFYVPNYQGFGGKNNAN